MRQKNGLYVSHSYHVRSHYEELLLLLKKSENHHISALLNYSITACPVLFKLKLSPPKCYIRRRIRVRLAKSLLLLVLLGDYFDSSSWMQYEVRHAAALNIPILGISPKNYPRPGKKLSPNHTERLHGTRTRSMGPFPIF